MNKKSPLSAFFAAILIGLILASALHFVTVHASTDVSDIPKPSIPEFTVEFVEHSYDRPPIYSIDQFTGENITIREGAHYQWDTLDFIIRNQQFPSDYNFYYNIRYKGQYADNWTEIYRRDTYPQQQSGEYSNISFLVSDALPPGYMDRLSIPVGAEVDFQVEAMVGGIFRISPEVPSGYEFRGETSGWSNTQTIIIGESQTPTSSPAPTPTPYPESQRVEQELVIGVAIAVAVIAAGLGSLIYLIKRK